MIGKTLSHYRILEKLGAGGMGEVYRAEDTTLGRQVAIKVLPEAFTLDPERLARFEREAKLLATLNHPHIAQIHGFEEADDTKCLVMELVEGDTLAERIHQRPTPVEEALEIAWQIAEGLEAAHDKGIIHRDLKPSNIKVTPEDNVKILDFGLAKALDDELPASELSQSPTLTQQATQAGVILGTAAYMSPEQATGKPVDQRTDIFSFGAMLYEMLTGVRPFQGDSALTTLTAVMTHDPEPPRSLHREIPADLQRIVMRCLEKDPETRYPSAHVLHQDLSACRARITRTETGVGALLRRPVFLTAAIVLVLALAATGWWLWNRNARAQWARTIAAPEVYRLGGSGEYSEALRLALEALEVLPGDPQMQQLLSDVSTTASLLSTPPGARVYVRGYREPDSRWELLGTTPLEEAQVARGLLRFRVELDGYETWESGSSADDFELTLVRQGDGPPGMIRVPEGSRGFGRAEPLPVPAFWIDRYEVTNAEYQKFVDDGGYRNGELWQEALAAPGAPAFEEVARSFVDRTGRSAPAGWELARHPADASDHPVGGVSWYEAAAYAAYRGKRLPTLYHWYQAAPWDLYTDILQVSNLNGTSTAPVGSYGGMGPHGTMDMAGNVREWAWNPTGERRYILGGSWNEPTYKYLEKDATPPLDRSPTNGIRLIQEIEPGEPALLEPIEQVEWDFNEEEPVADEIFAIYRGLYQYDPSDPEPRLESTDDSQPRWRRETVSLRTAYGEERFQVHVLLPRDASPPYQAVIYFPGSGGFYETNSLTTSLAASRFVPESGRALIRPVYDGLYERRRDPDAPRGPNAWREMMIHWSQDISRTIDYLETRDDIDADRIAFYGLSLGGEYGPIFTAIDDRFRASVLFSGHLHAHQMSDPPETIPLHFAPRSTVPVILINGNSDFIAPVKTSLEPMLAFQGAPPEHKKLVLLEGGHIPPLNEVIREALDWLDRYLGPVEGR